MILINKIILNNFIYNYSKTEYKRLNKLIIIFIQIMSPKISFNYGRKYNIFEINFKIIEFKF